MKLKLNKKIKADYVKLVKRNGVKIIEVTRMHKPAKRNRKRRRR